MIAEIAGPYLLAIVLAALLAVIVLALVWFGRRDETKRVRFGFFFERERHLEWPDMQDTSPEFRRWLASLFETYPYKYQREEDDDQEATS